MASEVEPDPDLIDLWTRIFAMARQGDTDTLAAYVDAGISVDLTNDKGESLLMLAAYHGHVDTVRMLLERGAKPNQLNDRGQSPLAGAVFKSEREVVDLLLTFGADANAGSPSALETARMFGNVELMGRFSASRQPHE